MPDLATRREQMVERQIARRGVSDALVLQAMRRVPRDAFVPAMMRELAYADSPLPIGDGQTISQPFIVAAMAEAAQVAPGDRVLEIGAGSGYAAAVLAQMGARVTTIERHARLAEAARLRLAELGYNVQVIEGDGTLGWPAGAPFDAILVTAGGPRVPDALKAQLAVGGRLVIPVGQNLRDQRLVKLLRVAEDRFDEEDLGEVAFVPLVGAQGWSHDGRAPARPPEGRAKAGRWL